MATTPASALRRAVERQPGHASAEAITRWLAARETERPGAGGGAPCPERRPRNDVPHREPRRSANRCPWSATGAALQRAGPPDDDHAGRRAAWCGADAVRRHAADDTAGATILTTAHDIHRITVAFSAGRISHSPLHRGRRGRKPRRSPSERLVTAAHADPSRPRPIPCASRHQPAGTAVGPSIPTTHLDPP